MQSSGIEATYRIQQRLRVTVARDYLIRLYTAVYKAAVTQQQPVSDELLAHLAQLHSTPPPPHSVSGAAACLGRFSDQLKVDDLVLVYLDDSVDEEAAVAAMSGMRRS